MSSLSGLMIKVLSLPKKELQAGTPESERPKEMAIIRQVIDPNDILVWRKKNIFIRRGCVINSGCPEIHFRISNSKLTKNLVVKHNTLKVVTTLDNQEVCNIEEVSDLQNLIEEIISSMVLDTETAEAGA